ncbi:DUF1566 domain-containing protein [Rhodanobacter glycinis]|uniref:Lcl C-terminal domain-containing protein n=1 Tax=Rhodanobacter glycinis TaxID=582702 RepID=UPI0013760B7D|nr:DUF1566 domain-containing protein [Rhodanobacter glycinis]
MSAEPLDLSSLIRPADDNKERYELSSDGTMITDHETGLTWDAEEREFPNADAAEKYVAKMNLGGFRWRIADDMEMQTIVDRSLREPACHPIFKSKGGWLLTSTPYKLDKDKPAGSSGYVWIVHFHHGGVGDDGRNNRCWCRAVRSVSPSGQ